MDDQKIEGKAADKLSGRWDVFRSAERLMTMDDGVWARHANPLSVYSRIVGGTAIFLALWSPFWIGWWGVLAIGVAAFWTWINPRLFAPPTESTSWATRAVLGERVFLARGKVPIPHEHWTVAMIATGGAAVFLGLAVLGFVMASFWLAFTAWHAATLAKVWFCDRMVWLWDDMKGATPDYQAWDRAEWDAVRDVPGDER